MAEPQKTKPTDTHPPVEIITDPSAVHGEVPVLTVTTKMTNNQTFYVRIRQPQGKSTLIAVHL